MAAENSTPGDLLEFKDEDLPPDLAYFYDAYECYGGDYENDLVSLREGLNAINAGRTSSYEEAVAENEARRKARKEAREIGAEATG